MNGYNADMAELIDEITMQGYADALLDAAVRAGAAERIPENHPSQKGRS